MSDILRRLNKFESETGAGVDAAGRRVYTGPLGMYPSPRDTSATMATHDGLIAELAANDPAGHYIRMLLNRRAGTPGQMRMELPDPAVASQSYNINMRD